MHVLVCTCWRGKLTGRSSPADSCLTAVAGGRGEAVKEQLNKPCVSTPQVAPPDRPGGAGGACARSRTHGNVRHQSPSHPLGQICGMHSVDLGFFRHCVPNRLRFFFYSSIIIHFFS